MFGSQRKWCFMDLVVDHQTGKLRETALWSNAGKAAILWEYARYVNATNYETFTGVMAGILVIHETVARFMNQRQQGIDNREKDKERA